MRRFRLGVLALLLVPCGVAIAIYDLSGGNPSPDLRNVSPAAFNRSALRLNVPLYWEGDADGDGAIAGTELAPLLFYPTSNDAWVARDSITPMGLDAIARVVADASRPSASTGRRQFVEAELDHATLLLIHTDVSGFTAADRDFVRRMLRVAELVDTLYERQMGTPASAARLEDDDDSSASLLRRNRSPACLRIPEPECSAIQDGRFQPVDIYPAEMQEGSASFCGRLASLERFRSPFVVARGMAGALLAVPYHEAYRDVVELMSAELRLAAGSPALARDEATRAYLMELAVAFETDSWDRADAAFTAAGESDSPWYVNVRHRETRWEPCRTRVTFGFVFGVRDDSGSALWANAGWRHPELLASAFGTHESVAPHATSVVRLAFTAGVSRRPFGGSAGTTFAGRVVLMPNMWEAGEREVLIEPARTVLATQSMSDVATSSARPLLEVGLHELAHLYAPAVSATRVPGPLEHAIGSSLEELRAQVGALHLAGALSVNRVVAAEEARSLFVTAILVALNGVARGFSRRRAGRWPGETGTAAVQIGVLLAEHALGWSESATSARGGERGALTIDFARMPAACERLELLVTRAIVSNDRLAEEEIVAAVDAAEVPMGLIAARYRDFGEPSYVYSVDWE